MKQETKEAIEKLIYEEYSKDIPNSEPYEEMNESAIQGALLLLQHPEILSLEGYHQIEWVSVEDRLPDEHIKVLVLYGDGNVLIGRIDSSNNWSIFYSDGINDEDYERPVTHWMPLPPPPKQ